MKTIGFVGWRGMVGSVLLERMQQEGDFIGIEPVFFSTSQVGQLAPDFGQSEKQLYAAEDWDRLAEMDVIVTCQGGDYTTQAYPTLRKKGWRGYWIDAASTLRMEENAVIVLDPVNRNIIDQALERGVLDFIGGNCTVSLMLMAIGGLFKAGLVEWVSAMTYQAASGAGAQNMRQLIEQMGILHHSVRNQLLDPAKAILEIDRVITETMRGTDFPVDCFRGVPLAGSLIPWIDQALEQGQTKEEWKGGAECNKILGNPLFRSPGSIPVDGLCVRVGTLRCHAQGLTVKLKSYLPMDVIQQHIVQANPWVQWIENTREASEKHLSPSAVSGSLRVPVGRVHSLAMGPEYLGIFTVGDQLLWGAAEPLRRMLQIIVSSGK